MGSVSPYLGVSHRFPTCSSLKERGTFHTVSPLTSKWGGLSIQCPPSLRSEGDFSYSVPPHFEVRGTFHTVSGCVPRPPHFGVGGTFHAVSPLTSKWGGLSIQRPPSLRSGGGDFLYFFFIFKKKNPPCQKLGGTFHIVSPPPSKLGGTSGQGPPPSDAPGDSQHTRII